MEHEKVRKLGADDYLVKPFDNKLLKEKVEQLLSTGGPKNEPSS
jgi:DNA-binding response OmpR family regulator